MPHRTARILAFVFALLALVTVDSRAGGMLNIAWDSCTGDGGVRNQDFACNSNVQVFTLVGSFEVFEPVPRMTELDGRLEISTEASGSTLAWWSSFGSSPCRPGVLSVDASPPSGAAACEDPWVGIGIGSVATGFVPDGTYTEGITVDVSLPAGQTAALVPGVEYFAFRLHVRTDKTVGAGACGGCSVPACIAWHSMEIYQPAIPGGPPTNVFIVGGGEYLVTWQSASLLGTACLRATPVENRTWGSIKGLYR